MRNTAKHVLVAALGVVLLSSGAVAAQIGDPATTQARTLADSIRMSLSPAQWKTLQLSATKLTAELSKIAASPALVKKVGRATSAAQLPAGFRSSLERSVSEYVQATGERDVEKIVAAVTALSMVDVELNAQAAGQKVQQCNEAKSDIRETITLLQDVLAKSSLPVTFKMKTFTIGGDCGVETAETTKTFSTKEAVESEIQMLESKLQQLGDCTQMLQVDLQGKLQKSQQMIQTISNIMKSIHDTLAAIVQNLKA